MIGSGSGAYGFYQLSNGTLSSAAYFDVGGSGASGTPGNGVFYQTGGTFTATGGWLGVGWQNYCNGVAYFSGGTTNLGGSPLQILTWSSGANTRAEVTINGGAVSSTVPVQFGNAAGYLGTGILNLMSGTLQTTNITKTATGATAILNFNGGTFKPAGNNSLTGLNSAYVFSGGAVIDTSVSSFTIAQNLLAPTGSGVATISVSAGGSGYIGAPYVQITGGNGDATAVANMVPDGTGTYYVSSITITNPGNNYSSVPTVALLGGRLPPPPRC